MHVRPVSVELRRLQFSMDGIEDVERLFKARNVGLTEKAKQALAIAVGLSGRISDCDEAFIASGLRRSNTLLAMLQDRHNLDFQTADNENTNFRETRENDIISAEIRKQLYGGRVNVGNEVDFGPSDDDVLDLYYEWYSDDESEYHGYEGEPEEETLSRFEDGPPDVVVESIRRSLRDGRKIVETFDLLQAAAELPLVAEVFQKGKLSGRVLRTEIGRLRTLEPYGERQQVSLTIENGRIEVRTFGLLDGLTYEDKKISAKQLIVNIAGSTPFILDDVVSEFEELLSSSSLSELDIQRFMEKHPGLLLGDNYSALRSHLILDRGDRGPLIPDFFAELPNEGYFDIIDLKKPDEQLIVGTKNRRGFSAAVYSAVHQLRLYRDYFEDPRNRKKFHERYGLRGWKPKIAVIIGRTPRGDAYPELITARRDLFDAEILTYDDILDRAKRRQLIINPFKK